MIVLIPAYEPDEKLVRLIENIVETHVGIDIVLVNDGSGSEYDVIFDKAAALGCMVIGHPVNRGKGFALTRGFEYIERFFPGCDVVAPIATVSTAWSTSSAWRATLRRGRTRWCWARGDSTVACRSPAASAMR